MVISASRRTDIPAFYASWFVNRIKAGYCLTINPFNAKQISRVSLTPQDIDVIVFWSRNPKPLIPHLEYLDKEGYRYYFQYTLLGYPRSLDGSSPSLDAAIITFKLLSDQIGPEKNIWRYDPLIISPEIDYEFHIKNFLKIASSLTSYTRRCVISIIDPYKKVQSRMGEMLPFNPQKGKPESAPMDKLIHQMADISQNYGMEIFSCAEEIDLQRWGVKKGKCIDDDLIRDIFNNDFQSKKDPYQRAACGCVISKDIGMYNTCLMGCKYCYATKSINLSQKNHGLHDPESPLLIGKINPEDIPPYQPTLRTFG